MNRWVGKIKYFNDKGTYHIYVAHNLLCSIPLAKHPITSPVAGTECCGDDFPLVHLRGCSRNHRMSTLDSLSTKLHSSSQK